jgi:hypothetical protein
VLVSAYLLIVKEEIWIILKNEEVVGTRNVVNPALPLLVHYDSARVRSSWTKIQQLRKQILVNESNLVKVFILFDSAQPLTLGRCGTFLKLLQPGGITLSLYHAARLEARRSASIPPASSSMQIYSGE